MECSQTQKLTPETVEPGLQPQVARATVAPAAFPKGAHGRSWSMERIF